MSNHTSPSTLHAPIRICAMLSTKLRSVTTRGIRAAAFWAAVLLPIAYVPVLYGLAGVGGTWSFLVLLTIHIACVVIGHEHNGPTPETSTGATRTDRRGTDDALPGDD